MPLFDTISSLFTTSSLGAVFAVNASAAASSQISINSGGKRTSCRGSRRHRSARKSRSFGQKSHGGCNSAVRTSGSCRKGKCSRERRSAIRRSMLKAIRSASGKTKVSASPKPSGPVSTSRVAKKSLLREIKKSLSRKNKAKKSLLRQAKKSASREAKKALLCQARNSVSRKVKTSASPCQRKAKCSASPAASKAMPAIQQIVATSHSGIPADVRERIAARVQHHLENRNYSVDEATKRRLWCALQRGDCRARKMIVEVFKDSNPCKPVVCPPCAPCQDRPCPQYAPCPPAAKCPDAKPCAPCPSQPTCPKDGPCPPCAPAPKCVPCATQDMFRGK